MQAASASSVSHTTAHKKSLATASTHRSGKAASRAAHAADSTTSSTSRKKAQRPAARAAVRGTKDNSTYAGGYKDGYAAGQAMASANSCTGVSRQRSSSVRPGKNTNKEQPSFPTVDDTSSMTKPISLSLRRPGITPSLRGSTQSLERQNARLESEGLERIEDDNDLATRIAHKLLVPLPASAALTVNASLPANRRYCRPWTALFLADLARAHKAVFRKPLEVSSAVRTVEYQKRLRTVNGNAAQAEGDIVSPHLTGATIDIPKDGLSRKEMDWMRRNLFDLQQAGKIDVEEEFQQSCFHITVYKSYAPPKAVRATGQTKTVRDAAGQHKSTDQEAEPLPSTATDGIASQGQ
jgi:hypothetical protein